MAKKRPALDEIFKKTDTEQEPVKDKVATRGIALKQSEWARIEEIAKEYGENRHSLSQWILRDFIRRWEEGDKPPAQETTRKILPRR